MNRVHYVLCALALGMWAFARVWYDPWRMSMFTVGLYDLMTLRNPRYVLVAVEAALCIVAPFVEPSRDVFMTGWVVFIVFIIVRLAMMFSVVHVRFSYIALELMEALFVLCTGQLVSLFSVNPAGNYVFALLAAALFPGGWLVALCTSRVMRARRHLVVAYFAAVSVATLFFSGDEDTTAAVLCMCGLGILIYAHREYSPTMWICEDTDLHGERIQIEDYIGALVFFLERGVVPRAIMERLSRDMPSINDASLPQNAHALLLFTEQVLYAYRKDRADCSAEDAARIYRHMIVSAIAREEDDTGCDLHCPAAIFDLRNEMSAQDIYFAVSSRAGGFSTPRFVEFLAIICACAEAWDEVVTRDSVLRMVLDELQAVDPEAAARVLALGAARDRETQLFLELDAKSQAAGDFSAVAEVLGNLSMA